MLAKSIVIIDAVEKTQHNIEHRASEVCGIVFIFQAAKYSDIARFGGFLS